MRGLAVLLAVFLSGSYAEIEVEEGVLVLTQDNFQEAVEANSLLLVEFYAPWCGHCKKLAPEYSAAATTLAESGSPAKLGKVDATEHKGLASQFGVKGYPTLKFFKNGEALEYTGGRTADTIVTWLNKKSGAAATTLETVEAAEELVSANKVTVLGFFKDVESDEAKAFLAAADADDDQVYGITTSSDVYKKFDISKELSVIIVKKFDEGRNDLAGDITTESVKSFVAGNALPLVVDFNQDTAKTIFSAVVKGHLFMFLSAKADDYEHKLHNARKLAKDLRGDIMFVSVTTDEPDHKKVLEFFGIDKEEVPTYRVAQIGDDIYKYKPDTVDFSNEYVKEFLQKFQAGELTPHLKTEDLPADWDAQPVKVLVGSNFASVAMDTSKDVLVEFYAPWCGHCKKLAPIWDELGEKFKDDDTVVIAKLDATANELTEVKVRGFPTIKLFKSETNEVVDYNGGRTVEDFVKFLRPEMAEKEPEADQEEKKDEL